MKALTQEQNARSPKSPLKVSDFITTLKQLEGTEYMLSGFFDEESTNLLNQIDSLLQLGGWKRVKFVIMPGSKFAEPYRMPASTGTSHCGRC